MTTSGLSRRHPTGSLRSRCAVPPCGCTARHGFPWEALGAAAAAASHRARRATKSARRAVVPSLQCPRAHLACSSARMVFSNPTSVCVLPCLRLLPFPTDGSITQPCLVPILSSEPWAGRFVRDVWFFCLKARALPWQSRSGLAVTARPRASQLRSSAASEPARYRMVSVPLVVRVPPVCPRGRPCPCSSGPFSPSQAKSKAAKKEVKEVEAVRLGPILKEDEELFGVAHIYAGFNDTFVVSSERTEPRTQLLPAPARREPRTGPPLSRLPLATMPLPAARHRPLGP